MQITARHESDDRFVIALNQHSVVVDQPGTGDAGPTPLELFIGSLAACAAFYATRFLRHHGLHDGKLRVKADYAMTEEHPSRVAAVHFVVEVPDRLPADIRAGVLRAVEQCTVVNSIRNKPIVSAELQVAAPDTTLAQTACFSAGYQRAPSDRSERAVTLRRGSTGGR